MEEWKPKFKVGDKVEITGNESAHGFEIGDTVEIFFAYCDYYLIKSEAGKIRVVLAKDIKAWNS